MRLMRLMRLEFPEESMTLVESLEARLTEDELVADAAIDGAADWHVLSSHRR